MRRFALAALAGFLAAPSAHAAPCDLLAGWARETVARDALPGMAFGVLKDGKVLCAEGIGTRSRGGKPITRHTNFHMASVSKAFVATAIMRLVAEGRIDLDQPVSAYLKGFGGEGPLAAVTVRQMLMHRSGMPDVTDYHWGRGPRDDAALRRYALAAGRVVPIAEAGPGYHYSNIAFDVLGAVVSEVTKMPFEAAMQQLILAPAGMKRSSFAYPPPNTDLAVPHKRDEIGRIAPPRAYPWNREHAPSSTLQSNVDDMLRFARAALAKSASIMPSATWERMFTPDPYVLFPDSPDPATKAARMGLGWFTARVDGKLFVLHPGQDDGFRSLLILEPESKAAVVLMTNSDWDEGGDKPDPYIGVSPAIAEILSLDQ